MPAAMNALGLQFPTIDAVGAFNTSQAAATQARASQRDDALKGLELLGRGAAYANGGKRGAPGDPKRWAEVVDSIATAIPDAAKYRDRPDLAPLLLDLSVSTSDRVKQAQDDTQIELALKDFDLRLKQYEDAKNKPTEVSPGASLAAPAAGGGFETVYTAPLKPKDEAGGWRPLTADEKVAAGLPPDSAAQVGPDGKIDAIGGAGTTINNMSGENAYDKTLNENFAKGDVAIQDAAQQGIKTLTTLDAMQQAVNSPDFYSGFGAQPVMQVKQIVAALGLDPSAATSMEMFNALSKQAALDAMGGSLGTGFSNADRDFIEAQVPNLAATPQGNQALIDIQTMIAHRKIEIAQFASDYADKHGGRLDREFSTALAGWAEENPLFEDSNGGAGRGAGTAGGSAGVTARPADKSAYDALPSGTKYQAPDGSIRVKP